MKVKTSVNGGRLIIQHNETLLRSRVQAKRLKVKTGIKAGGMKLNHNETLLGA